MRFSNKFVPWTSIYLGKSVTIRLQGVAALKPRALTGSSHPANAAWDKSDDDIGLNGTQLSGVF